MAVSVGEAELEAVAAGIEAQAGAGAYANPVAVVLDGGEVVNAVLDLLADTEVQQRGESGLTGSGVGDENIIGGATADEANPASTAAIRSTSSAVNSFPLPIPGQHSATGPFHTSSARFSSQKGHVAHCRGRTG